MSSQFEKIEESHKKVFGVVPSVVATAPCRFHLMGEHTWFFDGKTMSVAIDKFVSISISPRDDEYLYFHFTNNDETKHISLESMRFRKEDKWANSIKSVLYGFMAEKFISYGENSASDDAVKISGLDFCITSDLPQAAGMGVTTAMKVCAAVGINEFFDLDCSDSELFSVIDLGNTGFLKEKNENHFAENITAMFSEPCAVVISNHSDKKLSETAFSVLDFNFTNKSIILLDAKVPRFSCWNEESIMKEEYRSILDSLKIKRDNVMGGWIYTEDKGELNEALGNLREDDRRHLLAVISEHKCVLNACNALKNEDFALFAKSVNKSHENMRDFYDISCPEIDWILKRLVEINPKPDSNHNPVCCGRITGQGFARCLYAILDDENLPQFEEKLAEYTRIFGFKTSCFKVLPVGGVKVMKK